MKRSIPQTSIQTYADQRNAGSRTSHKSRILAHLSDGGSYSTRQLSRVLNMSYAQVQKRLSDLKAEGRIEEAGVRMEHGNPNSLFKCVAQIEMFPAPAKKTRFELLKDVLRDSLDSHKYEEVLRKFTRTINGEVPRNA